MVVRPVLGLLRHVEVSVRLADPDDGWRHFSVLTSRDNLTIRGPVEAGHATAWVSTIAAKTASGLPRWGRPFSQADANGRKYDEYIANYTGNLAELALDREQWAEAESLAREALALAEKVGRQELIASDCHHLAKDLLKQNPVGADGRAKPPLQEALSLSRRAIEIFTHLRHPDLQSAQETLAEIEKKIK